MIRSLFSGASGMKNHQIRMDVIANNVANVNTYGFKAARCNFQDTLYQIMRAPSSGPGGVNPSQVGLGVMVSSITTDTGQGALQSTGRMLDVSVQGNGWFILSISRDPELEVEGVGAPHERYTREGVFYIDNTGYLVNSNGYYVCDAEGVPIFFEELEGGDEPAEFAIDTINIEKDGTISYTVLNKEGVYYANDGVPIGLAMFANQDGLRRDGQNLFRISPASGEAADASSGASGYRFGVPSEEGYGFLSAGYLEMSNVDLTDEFIFMITTQRGYQANARTVTTSDAILEELLNIKR